MKKFVWVLLGLMAVCAALFLVSCKGGGGSQSQGGPPPNSLELVFVYGSEKEQWIKQATDAFNSENHKASDGRNIYVTAVPMGSGEMMDDLLSGSRQIHLVSPASEAFIKLGNSQYRVKTGKDIVGPTKSLVVSPVVIAMWKPMAQAIGWGKKPVGWAEILALARNQQGWSAYGHPEWGRFKFGHTHPEYSNSGLISVLAEVYAAKGSTKTLTSSDLADPRISGFIQGIEASVVHYGSSTGFFATKMFDNGPQYLSAAVLYENLVTESTTGHPNMPFPVVAIYPKEGTFWSDHPIGIVQREWVTQAHKDAAKQYIDYLLAPAQQNLALTFGFRPGDASIPLGAPVDTAHGVDPKEPKTTLAVPSADVINGALELWKKHKKHSNVVLLLDTSGSMNDDNKITNAKAGAAEMMKILDSDDQVSVMPFNTDLNWLVRERLLKTGRSQTVDQINGLFAGGGTKLYEAINMAYNAMRSKPTPGKISAIVVLSDGQDTESSIQLDTLLSTIRSNNETKNIRVFTIGYGSEADKEVLQSIADATNGKYYEGNSENIRSVFRDISTFF